MSFLPEEDQEFLGESGISYELLTEKTPDGSERRGVFFPGPIHREKPRASDSKNDGGSRRMSSAVRRRCRMKRRPFLRAAGRKRGMVRYPSTGFRSGSY